MKIILEQAQLSEPEIIIRGDSASPHVQRIIELLNGKQSMQKMFFFKHEKEYVFDISEVVYFEADNNKVYAHIASEAYDVHHKLYELEILCRLKGFIRINKGVIVNINYVSSVEAEFSGNFRLNLKDSNIPLTLSRKYVKEFRKYIMEEN